MIERTIRSAVLTGPTGPLGRAVCQKLLDEGCKVYAISYAGSKRGAQFAQHPNLEIVLCDAAEYAKLPELIGEKVDAFFHLAWTHTIAPLRNDMPAQIDNIRYTIEAVRAAAALGCQVFVGAGSQAEYGRAEGVLRPDTPAWPENGYGMAKLCAGQMSRMEAARVGIDHIWPRVLSVYGPYDGPTTMIPVSARKLLAGERPALTEGKQEWDYLYVADAGDAFWKMARHGRNGAIYPVGSGTARPLREYIEKLRDAIDPSLPLGFGEIPYGPQQIMHLQADISTLQEDTGFAPTTDFDTGIRKTIEWIRSTDK